MTVTATQIKAKARQVGEGLVATDGPAAVLPVVGLKELGWMFDVEPNTPYQWKTRRARGTALPDPTLISGNPTWPLPQIYEWAATTGKTIVWDPWGLYAPAEPTPRMLAEASKRV